MKIIEVRDFSFRYANGSRESLSHVSLDVEEGTFNVLCGKSGCGKSTLLRQLKSDLAPFGSSSGKICYYGRDLKEVGHRQQSQEIGYVLQNPENQIVTDKVWHELAFGLESLGYDTPTIRLRVAEMASYFGIHQWFYKNVSELSGGQKQRVAIAGIIAMRPRCLIMDEPTAMLDPKGRKEVMSTIKRLKSEQGVTVVLITHYMDEAVQADRVIVMDDGKILVDGTPEYVFQNVGLLHSVALDVPQAAELMYKLREYDIKVPISVLNEKDCVEVLSKLLEGKIDNNHREFNS